MLASIPEPHRATAAAALFSAFGTAPVEDLSAVHGGVSGALTYRVQVRGAHYLLRLEVGRSAMRNSHQYTCMAIAAQAGVAPPLVHADDAAGVAIMAFVQSRPLASHPGGPPALARAIGALVARLQAGPVFPALHPYVDMLGHMFAAVAHGPLFAPGVLQPYVDAFARLREAYTVAPAHGVACHNDPNANNVLFDGERLWLIDWETAYLGDPLTDLAITLDTFAPAPALETALLAGWRERPLDRREAARLALMRQITRLYYAALIFTVTPAAQRPAPAQDVAPMHEHDFRNAVAEGTLPMGSSAMMFELGRMQLARFDAGLRAPGYEAALAIAREG